MADHSIARPLTAEDEARRIFDLQHKASRHGPPADARLRRDRLERLRAVVATNAAAFAKAISDDFGVRSRTETELLEIVPTMSAIRHARKNVARWMRPERRRVDPLFQPASARVRYEPLGVIGIISPWNYPLQLAVSPLVDALAAGNRAMVKPSELTPAFSELLRRAVAERFDESEVAVVTGGVEVGQAFASLPFDHLLFTGSTAIGRKVYLAAAANLVPVTLELGGKSPVVVCPDYDLAKAARSIAFGKFVNAGQTCIAPDYVLVPEGKERELRRGGDGAGAPLLPDHRRQRRLFRPDRRAPPPPARRGDRGGPGGGRDRPRPRGRGRPGARQDRADDRARRPRRQPVPHRGDIRPGASDPALSRPRRGDRLHRRARPAAGPLLLQPPPPAIASGCSSGAISGGVTLNGTLLHVAQEGLPFGGVGPSGIGAYHGQEGFRRFSHARAVHKVGFINVFEKLGPPWGKMAAALGRRLAKRR